MKSGALRFWCGSGLALASMLANSGLRAAEPADLLLVNGKVVTVDSRFAIRSALAIRDGKILAVGGKEIASRYNAPQTIDLHGRTVLPGFIDTHLHPMTMSPRAIDPARAHSIGELQQMLRDKARQLGAGQWITGYGWAEANLKENRNVVRADLDAAAPDNPVVLTRAGGHSAVGNSRALALAKIDRTTPDPLRGVIDHGPDGEPNGIIRERTDLYGKLVPQDSPEALRPGYVASLRSFLSLGLTSVIVAASSIRDEVHEELRPEQQNRYVRTLEGYRLQHVNPVALPAKQGVFIAFGSDNLPIDPRVGLYAAVTRKGMSGTVYGPDEAVSIQEAIRMYTLNSAYLSWDEHKKGSLEPGKLADLIVIDRD
jgi:predicted amidohydrolase YtcJ